MNNFQLSPRIAVFERGDVGGRSHRTLDYAEAEMQSARWGTAVKGPPETNPVA